MSRWPRGGAPAAAASSDVVARIAEQRRRQNLSLLRIYNYYRIVLGTSLLLIFERGIGERLLGSLDPDRFVLTVALYILANVAITFASVVMPQRYFDRQTVAFLIVVADTLALALLMHFSEGVGSGLGTLLIVSVAAGNVLVMGRFATVLAAVAALAVLYEEFYLSLLPRAPPPDFFQAGVLGAIYFATSLLIQNLSRRLLASETTALLRSAEVSALERLNRLVVERMQVGVLVLDRRGDIRFGNAAGHALLGRAAEEEHDRALPPALREAWQHWLHTPDAAAATTVRTHDDGLELRLTFSSVADSADHQTLVFMEDTTALQQQAQQLKLAGLGRLSASIAHEIRNPLGAASHAAQLLAESPALDAADQRLTAIIQTHVRRMNAVIENVLELSRRHSARPRRLRLGPWLGDFADQYRQGSDDPVDIELEVRRETTIEADPSQLEQVLVNLVGNALRYSARETNRRWARIVVDVDAASARPFLEVRDRGPGIPDGVRAHLFEPFFTTEDTGSGLGLFICRELCEANQIQLVERPAAEGACFRLQFPPTRPAAASRDDDGREA